MKKFWLIEDGKSDKNAPMFANCKPGLRSRWTYTFEEAIRLCRQKDAEEYASLHLPAINIKLGGIPYRIVEYQENGVRV